MLFYAYDLHRYDDLFNRMYPEKTVEKAISPESLAIRLICSNIRSLFELEFFYDQLTGNCGFRYYV
ncbi:unnamed protein product [Penicillium roqueforti FM164]|uniref:Genomic scaffold, ProqFM164S02 n=1 Tax=Penicillium roqueforti (strain FM164) TaxID=1365484 RepID=W6QFH6_PENRF|nr:unnamed protein product [Penicillium roqueforti FM164]